MSTKKYFANKNAEFCYPKQYHLDYMVENDIQELEIIEAERETNSPFFYCNEFHQVGEVGEGCGRICEKYIPNNGKNGRCKHSGFVYTPTNKKVLLKIKPTTK